ncbi:AraC family transcriptional regulator [Actinacidiphila bryophytorum]|uniref:AraC family transcriptional regulator n=1 Tax=Actinacidiphila bryophytorum TaxID=1436133 RepID=UPI002176963F|nr:AraC family transcriptional regulator [Actinacidiphila bryophytorum]UWE10324.1 AraC family transcriptional regulator [Actinacidiphila bryophytorum]
MDVLSDAVIAMRTGRPHAMRHELYAPWGMGFASGEGAGFHVVLRGSCWLVPAGEPPIALNAGDVALVRGDRAHGIADNPASPLVDFTLSNSGAPYGEMRHEGSGPSTVVLCGAYLLDRTRAHPVLSEIPPVVHLPAHLGRYSSLRAAVELLGSEIDRPRPGTGAIVPSLLDTLLLYILRAWFEQRSHDEGAAGWAAALSDPAIGSALSAIHHDPVHPWTVEELGARAGLSRAAFARRFTALVGQPPLAYLTWWRMITAARVLRESDAPLRVVARQAGYGSEIAFAAAFKREYGVSPGRYRRHADADGDREAEPAAGSAPARSPEGPAASRRVARSEGR